jgi:hypothetical protein
LLSGAQAESVFERLIEAELANVGKKSAAN